jgi:nitrogen-specific signal transduction histidine kinase
MKKAGKKFEKNDFLISVIEALNYPFYVINPRTHAVEIANSASGMKDSVLHKPCHVLFHNKKEPCSSDESCPVLIIQKSKKPVIVEHVHYDADGLEKIVEVHAHPILDEDGCVQKIIEYAFDITERKRAEAALKNAKIELEIRVKERTQELEDSLQQLTISEKRFRELFNSMSSGVAVYKPIDDGNDFIFKDINKAGEKLSKISRSEVIGKRVTDLFPQIKEFGLFDVFKRVAQTGKPQQLPLSQYKDQRIQQWVENYVYRLPTGEVVAVYDDLTEKKQAEEDKQKLEEQLRQSQKLQAIGQLAGGIAHDFNNLMAGIMGCAEMLQVSPAFEKENKLIKSIIETTHKASDLTKSLLSFARTGKRVSIGVNIHKTLDAVCNILNRTIDKSIVITHEYNAKSLIVEGDPVELQNAFLNLAINARDAMPDGGIIAIKTHNITLDEVFCSGKESISPGAFILVELSDTGAGIPDHIKDRVFEPFFTTKPKGEGTGLGLSAIYGCVNAHHGYMSFKSQEKKGTHFSIFLPINEKAKTSASYSRQAVKERIGHGHIMLVEDEDIIRETSQMALTKLGYQVTAFCNGKEAIDFYRNSYDCVDLVLLDMVMPGMNGVAVFKELKSIDNQTKAIIISGYASKDSFNEAIEEGVLDIMQKPIRIKDLSNIVAQVLS